MIGVEILFAAVFLFAAWHGIKHGTPRAYRAMSARRQTGIANWQSSHPNAPTSARWLAGAAKGVTALRWGPGHFKREFSQAFKDAWDEGKQKYKLVPPPGVEPTTETRSPRRTKCQTCRGDGDLGGKPCPICQQQTPARGQAPVPTPASAPQLRPDGRPDLRPVNNTPRGHQPPGPAQPTRRNSDMSTIGEMKDQTHFQGGEVVDPESLQVEMKAVAQEATAELEDANNDMQRASAELEDAQADMKRAQASAARTERTAASLARLELKAEDVAMVAAMVDPARQWADASASRVQAAEQRQAAARSRVSAADQRLAMATAAQTMAARHIELEGQGAAGKFYRRKAS